MNELLTVDQEISVVPKDFKNSNKGKIARILENSFTIELMHPPVDFEEKNVMEFYSQTKHGTLYFTSPIVKTDGNILVVLRPRRHRFLQRRTFSRVKFVQELQLEADGKIYNATSRDLSAGGLKIEMNESLNLDLNYNMIINLPGGETLNTKFEPVKIEKSDEGIYTIAGRFVEISKKDKMKVIQYCMRKDIEYSKDKHE